MAVVYDERHGGPYDRGGADAYYRRPFRPHYYAGGSYTSRLITPPEMTDQQVHAYRAGYRATCEAGDHKDWGERGLGLVDG